MNLNNLCTRFFSASRNDESKDVPFCPDDILAILGTFERLDAPCWPFYL